MKIGRDFFLEPTLKVAKKLLGKYIFRKYKRKLIIGKIVETEAYIGPKDKASHAYCQKEQSINEKKKIIYKNFSRIKNYIQDPEIFLNRILKLKNAKVTNRNLVEYLKGGHVYIYLIYGLYYQFNITTHKEGYPQCVLIRSLEPISGNFKVYPNGPAKLCNFLKIDSSFWGHDLIKSEIFYLENGENFSEKEIIKTKRIGIEYAKEDSQLPWRFYIKGNKWVSKL